jgi:hypothetical protein
MVQPFQSTLLAGRQRYLALGAHTSAAVSEIRERGLPAALEAVAAMMGGVSQPRTVARSLVAVLAKAPDFGSRPYEVRSDNFTHGLTGEKLEQRMVFTPHLSWRFQGRRQVASLEMWPMFSATRGRAPKRLP